MFIGIDIIEADRFADMDTSKLLRMFSQREIEYFRQKNYAPESIAGLFCAKEAFFKALGTGVLSPESFMEVEVLHQISGAPYYKFTPKILANYKMLSTAKIQLSISNTKKLSVAVCIIFSSGALIRS